jgi:hypothetical protein
MFKMWRKTLWCFFIVILIHFFKDLTQDILKIATPLDYFGNINEDLSLFSAGVQKTFMLFGFGSFAVELFLILFIPLTISTKKPTYYDLLIVIALLFLGIYFITALLLDPRFKIL